MQDNYLESTRKLFEHYKTLGTKTVAQLEEQDLCWQHNSDSNSIAVIIQHLSGNMKSRWTDFLHSDGEKEWRNREAEFENITQSKKALMEIWEDGWGCLFQELNTINKENLGTIVYIRNEVHTVLEAINRQLGHCAYHVGQMVFIGKMIKGNKWASLSIPKGKSEEFNKEKFSKPKRK